MNKKDINELKVPKNTENYYAVDLLTLTYFSNPQDVANYTNYSKTRVLEWVKGVKVWGWRNGREFVINKYTNYSAKNLTSHKLFGDRGTVYASIKECERILGRSISYQLYTHGKFEIDGEIFRKAVK